MTGIGWPKGTESLLEEILTDAYGDDEQLWALRQAFEDSVALPADAFVIGEPVAVVAIDYDGNPRRGLTARCRRTDGTQHAVAASDVSFAEGTAGDLHVAAYRKWLGLEPVAASMGARRPRRYKVSPDQVDLEAPVELVVLAPKERAARCRVLGTEREVTLRSSEVWEMVAGEVVTVRLRKQWQYAGHPYVSGVVEARRLDIPALGLVPLRLEDEWPWDPEEEYWGEEGEPLEDWAQPILAAGPRSSFEMEQVLPGADRDDWEWDPIIEASEAHAAGDRHGAEKTLAGMLTTDLRCLDAHAHLGNFCFDHRPEKSLRHYEVGVRIGELSLGPGFEGLLPWGRVDNRPFLRCMHGYGLCLWRLGRLPEAAAVFERMLWLNPTDNQGIRGLLPPVLAGEPWDERHG